MSYILNKLFGSNSKNSTDFLKNTPLSFQDESAREEFVNSLHIAQKAIRQTPGAHDYHQSIATKINSIANQIKAVPYAKPIYVSTSDWESLSEHINDFSLEVIKRQGNIDGITDALKTTTEPEHIEEFKLGLKTLEDKSNAFKNIIEVIQSANMLQTQQHTREEEAGPHSTLQIT